MLPENPVGEVAAVGKLALAVEAQRDGGNVIVKTLHEKPREATHERLALYHWDE